MSASGSSNFIQNPNVQKIVKLKGDLNFTNFFAFRSFLLSKTCLQKIEKNQILEILNEMLIDMS